MSDVSGHLDVSKKEGRREKAQIDLFHACFQPLDESKMKGHDQIKQSNACALCPVRPGKILAQSDGPERRRQFLG